MGTACSRRREMRTASPAAASLSGGRVAKTDVGTTAKR